MTGNVIDGQVFVLNSSNSYVTSNLRVKLKLLFITSKAIDSFSVVNRKNASPFCFELSRGLLITLHFKGTCQIQITISLLVIVTGHWQHHLNATTYCVSRYEVVQKKIYVSHSEFLHKLFWKRVCFFLFSCWSGMKESCFTPSTELVSFNINNCKSN